MISIRQMRAEDIPASRELLAQLGYQLAVEEVRRRYDAVTRFESHALIVAEDDGSIVALCHVYARPALDKPPEAVVQALVVDETRRGGGVGKLMMDAAERWAVEQGFDAITLSSHDARSDAHAFYEAFGYECVATSRLFRRALRKPIHYGQ
jgi:GNAT superfamily N-acetyltransferase